MLAEDPRAALGWGSERDPASGCECVSACLGLRDGPRVFALGWGWQGVGQLSPGTDLLHPQQSPPSGAGAGSMQP